MSACTSDGDGTGRDDLSEPGLATPSPGHGGVIRFGILGEPATLDPYSPIASDLTYALARPVYRSLYRFDPSGSAVPDLVASIEIHGRGARVELKAARWSNGRPLNARDVVASWRRAAAPSGFAAIDKVRASGARVVDMRGTVTNWQRTLARLTFVLPEGRALKGVSSGPFVLGQQTRGLQYSFEPNPQWDGEPVLPSRVVVRVVERLEILLALLERGRLDAAAPPTTVNLQERLHEVEIESEGVLGWELIYLDLSGSPLTDEQKYGLYRLIDRGRLEKGLIRSSGRLAHTLRVGAGQARKEATFPAGTPPAGAILQLAVPIGDELLELVQRTAQRDLARAGIRLELIAMDAAAFYGAWRRDDPIHLALRRSTGAPGYRIVEQVPDALPLWHTDSVLAWRPGVHGLRVNPTLEGPLWNASEWWIEENG